MAGLSPAGTVPCPAHSVTPSACHLPQRGRLFLVHFSGAPGPQRGNAVNLRSGTTVVGVEAGRFVADFPFEVSTRFDIDIEKGRCEKEPGKEGVSRRFATEEAQEMCFFSANNISGIMPRIFESPL